MPAPYRVAWITGASSGIGFELAKLLAAEGVQVAASARSIATDGLPAGIHAFPLDVTDAEACEATARAIEQKLGPIDLVVFGAGAYQPFDAGHFDASAFARINAVNYLGVTNALAAVVPGMLARKSGHVSWIASVAGYRGLPKAAYYGPTKAALINLAESLWQELTPLGLSVSIINPGFVKTPMTSVNDFEMPFLMTPEAAAKATLAGLKRRKFEIAYPTRFVLILKFLRLLPNALALRLISRSKVS